MNTKMKKVFGILLTLALVLGLMPGMSLTAYADSEVKYLDASGTEQSITDYTVVDSSTTTFTQGWYVVNSDVEINQRIGITIAGNANLILCDGAKLTVTSSRIGIYAARGSLTIYAQSSSDNMGELEVTGTGTAGIRLQKNLTINGGKIETQGSNGIFSQDADITINGGNVTADGGIFFNTSNNLTITGGKVIAMVTGTDSGIDTEGEVIISGGNVSVTGDDNPAIRGTVKNSIAGTGWTNKEGTEGKADIAISTGQTLSYKKVQFPAVVTAYPLWVGGVQVTSANKDDVLGDADEGATVSYTPATTGDNAAPAKLALNGYNNNGGVYTWAQASNANNIAVIYAQEDLEIELSGTNTINNPKTTESNDNYYCIYTGNGLTITGNGTLSATGERGIYAYGNSPLTISNGTVNATGGYYGISAKNIIVNGGSVEATANASSSSGITLSSGGSLTISNGTVTASGTHDGISGVYRGGTSITIDGGTLTASSTNTGNANCGIANCNLTINDGTVIASGGRGIYGGFSNKVTINGGQLSASGTNMAISAGVINTIEGTGWTDTDGTAGRAIIETSANGRSFPSSLKKAEFPRHEHSLTYAAGTGDQANTITATCDNTDGKCDLDDGTEQHHHVMTLTVTAPTLTTYGMTEDGISASATLTVAPSTSVVPGTNSSVTTLTGAAAFNAETGLTIAETDIKYYKATKNDNAYTKDGEALAAAPTEVGDYVAEITVGEGNGAATASLGYSIGKATLTDVSVAQNGTLTYTGEAQTPAVTTAATAVNNQTVTFTYSKTQDGTYGDMPTVTNVADGGTFYYKASAANHEDYAGSFTVTMDKANSIAATVAAVQNLSFDGEEKTLVTVTGEATGGTMNYAVTAENAAPTDGWDTAIPTETYYGTHYVWYKVVGDDNHNDTTPQCIPVEITDPYADARLAAAQTVGEVNANDYIADDQQKVTDAKNAAMEAIVVATSEGAITDAVNTFNTTIANCTTQAAADLAEAQATATAALNDVDPEDYIAEDKQTVADAKAAALTAIGEAASAADVTTAMNTFNTAIAGCTTQAAADLADAKTIAAGVVNAVNAEDYIAADQPTVTDAKTAALEAIEAAASITDVENAMSAFDTAINGCMTQAAADQADNVAALINALPEASDVKTTDRAAIEAARAAYDALNETQQALIDPAVLQKLEDAEGALDTIDQAAADKVSALINALPAAADVTTANKEAITAARTAFDALEKAQQKKVTADTQKKLTDAEDALAALEKAAADKAAADQAAAESATAKIGAIGTVEFTDASKAKIDEARAAYDALTADQKALVSAETVKALTDAEKAYADLKAAAEKPIVNEVTISGGVYQLNHTTGTARFTKPTSKNLKKLVILDSVQANDRNYLVTEVKAGAGRGMKKLTTLTVGANVAKFGSNAFRDCVKLKKIILKNPNMKMKGFGKDSFRNIKAKATFKVPAKVMKKYKKWLIGKAKAPAMIRVKKGK